VRPNQFVQHVGGIVDVSRTPAVAKTAYRDSQAKAENEQTEDGGADKGDDVHDLSCASGISSAWRPRDVARRFRNAT